MRITESKLRRIIRSVIAESVPRSISEEVVFELVQEFYIKRLNKGVNNGVNDYALEIKTKYPSLYSQHIRQAFQLLKELDPMFEGAFAGTKKGYDVRAFFYNVKDEYFEEIKNICQ